MDLDPATVAVLRAHKAMRGALHLDLARADALVFASEQGTHLHPEHFTRTFTRAVKRCAAAGHDVPAVRLHDLRHCHATLLLAAGIPVKVVSERLGHASATVTLGTYVPLIRRRGSLLHDGTRIASPHGPARACVTRTVTSPDQGKSADTATPSVPPAGSVISTV